jgi:hypothetical protein
MRPIAKCYQGGLAGRRCCLNIATIRSRRRLCWVAGGLLGRQHGSQIARGVCVSSKAAWMVVPSIAIS